MRKKKLITSALPYVNNVPHLGNIIGCVLSADVYARICRLFEFETLYICATDEYGTATENKAREEGLTPKEICDKYHEIHHQVYKYFNISFDFFGRTSCPEHSQITQEIYQDLERSGFIEEKETEQTYCETDQMFLADRYVEGNCPHCDYEEARGDQCDQCGKLLQPTELKNPKCQVCGNTPSRKLTKHLYLKLPDLEPKLKNFHQQSTVQGKWSSNAISVVRSWIDKGLISRPITRDLSWGVKVPKKGYENKVFYVWFDAPIGYISSTMKMKPSDWQTWWLSPETTELYQFMAKDNILFHTVVFPASLLGTGKPWTLLHHINSTEYLNYENTKFSKSRGTGVFGTDVMNSDIPVDLWRFYLLFNRPEKSDSNFSWDQFLDDINNNF
ncbi:MAG: methionine--tRNA ligase, partial [Proteobacteria bacterium]|nr:methionine--tRNA ligase [Pseudomonadota bacterium]